MSDNWWRDQKHGWFPKRAVPRTEDFVRVKDLPRRTRPAKDSTTERALVRMMTERYLKPENEWKGPVTDDTITSLRPVQAWALYELGIVRGLVGAVDVGHGKTGLDILSPLAVRSRLALLLVPASLLSQFETHYELWRKNWHVPSCVIRGRDFSARENPNCTLHVMSYSRLSRPDASDFLEKLGPDFIVCDEVHKLRNSDSARYRRLTRYFANHPSTKFAGWSGSLTDDSVMDYWHFCAYALREGSPLPLKKNVAEEWAVAIDPGDDQAPPGVLVELCEPGEDYISGYRRRLLETQGFVATDSPAIDAEVEVRERPVTEIPAEIRAALTKMRMDWQRPDEEEIVDRLTLARTARELACGFYYYWYFPNGEPKQLVKDWLDARKAWHKELRAKLGGGREFLDSPLLCTRAAMRYHGDAPPPTWEDCTVTVRGQLEAEQDDSGQLCLDWLDCMVAGIRERPTPTAHDNLARELFEMVEDLVDADQRAVTKDLVELISWFGGSAPMAAEARAVLERVLQVRDAHSALPVWDSEHWPAWRDVKDLVKPETRTQRVHDFLARDASEWAHTNHGIVWYTSRAFGEWVAEVSGLPHHGGGPKAGENLEAWIESGAPSSIVASMRSHGTGRDGLQKVYACQLVGEPPSSATAWQQLLGRLHRLKQKARLVMTEYYAHVEEVRDAIEKATVKADYVEETLGATQKITTGMAKARRVY